MSRGVHMLGRKLSEETKHRISEANRGMNNAFYGKKHTLETRKRMSKLKKGVQQTPQSNMKRC